MAKKDILEELRAAEDGDTELSLDDLDSVNGGYLTIAGLGMVDVIIAGTKSQTGASETERKKQAKETLYGLLLADPAKYGETDETEISRIVDQLWGLYR